MRVVCAAVSALICRYVYQRQPSPSALVQQQTTSNCSQLSIWYRECCARQFDVVDSPMCCSCATNEHNILANARGHTGGGRRNACQLISLPATEPRMRRAS